MTVVTFEMRAESWDQLPRQEQSAATHLALGFEETPTQVLRPNFFEADTRELSDLPSLADSPPTVPLAALATIDAAPSLVMTPGEMTGLGFRTITAAVMAVLTMRGGDVPVQALTTEAPAKALAVAGLGGLAYRLALGVWTMDGSKSRPGRHRAR